MSKEFYRKLIDNNKEWVAKQTAQDPEFFTNLAKGQNPPLLWIGCADSRVPANQITGTKPGEVFVHRNIANMVIHTDMNMLSVLDYAVGALQVKHIIICGHYGCGGVQAAMSNKSLGLINNWVRHIKDVYKMNQEELNAISDEKARFDRMVELNVKEQVHDLAKTSIIQRAWKNGQDLQLHGWVYELHNGLVKDLNVSMSNADSLDKVFKFDF
ncbi:carbonate dehydratase [Ascidiimonas sp. W6]|uniref:carbonate dehydratase n=1 Tax=Ascidiimonas meishanensis TaxID=3128903 RepID=UPI0030EDBE22